VSDASVDELLSRNRELVARLEELETSHREVVASYSELSDELERTNQGVVALYAEIDDKSRLLREANESKSQFLNNISHELRTPGNSVLGLARLLLDPAAEPLSEEQRQQVELIRSSAEDLVRLVNELLDLAKAESGRIEPVLDVVDLASLFDELRGTTAPLVSRPGVELVVEAPVLHDELLSDASLLRHVLRNLLSNAVKFTERGSVRMTGVQTGRLLQLQVCDTGIGIAEADQPRVFEDFYQVRNMLQSEVKGSGLGLPYARQLTRVLGGELRLRSTVGKGTTFEVLLPMGGAARRVRTREVSADERID
jgi:signal transduction histidine kinase